MTQQLLHRIEGHLKQTGMPPTTFGRRAVNDPRLVDDLRAGRRAGDELVARVDRFLTGAAR